MNSLLAQLFPHPSSNINYLYNFSSKKSPSSFFALFEDEEGVDIVQNLLQQAKRGEVKIFVSFVTFTEAFYITLQEEGEKEAHNRIKLMNKLTIQRVESSPELGLKAGRLKAKYRISFADTWIAATALLYNAILVHKDPEFEQLNKEISLLTLPYKSP